MTYRLRRNAPIGRVVHWLVVRHQLRAIFDHRNTIITERFGAIVPAAITPGKPVEQRA